MGVPPVPADKDFAVELAEINRRLEALEGIRAMQATTMRGGTFELINPDVDQRMLRFGAFGDAEDGTPLYGIVIYDSLGSIVHVVLDDQRGMVYPHEHHQWIIPTPQSITSATFVNVAECRCRWPNADVLITEAAIITPAGTTAEVRLHDGIYGNDTSVVAVPESHNGIVSFAWLHPWSVGWGDSAHPDNFPFIQFQVKRTAGADPVTVYPPRHLTFVNRRFSSVASAAGGGRLF